MVSFDISTELTSKWQDILNLLADIYEVPAALIMQVHEQEIEVFLSSQTEGNPYHKGDKESLRCELYCETVMETRSALCVANALADPVWDHNPDIKLNMIAYLGFPLEWPDGHIFGTICVLDSRERVYSDKLIQLLSLIKDLINRDLRFVYEQQVQLDCLKDVHNLKIAEEQKKVFIEAFTAINHNLNQPLTVIAGYIDILEREWDVHSEKDQKHLEYISGIKESVFRMIRTLRSMSTMKEYQTEKYVNKQNMIAVDRSPK